jgi:hypothetical protein
VRIEGAAMDMVKAYISGITEYFSWGLFVLNFSLTVDGRFCSISSHKCPYSLGVAFFEREVVVPQI